MEISFQALYLQYTIAFVSFGINTYDLIQWNIITLIVIQNELLPGPTMMSYVSVRGEGRGGGDSCGS